MQDVPSIVIWLTSACRSMMPMCRSIAALADVPVYLVIRKNLSQDRRQLGWVPDDGGCAHVTTLDDQKWRHQSDEVFQSHSNALHLVAGYQKHPFLRYVCFAAIARRCRFFVLSEAPLNMEMGIRRLAKEVYLRRIVAHRVSPIVDSAERIFCLSGRRYQALEDVGWPTHKIVPFGYFPADRGRRAERKGRDEGPLRLVCIGFLRAYKGVDLLLNALGTLARANVRVTCDITGDGPEMGSLRKLQRELGLESCVRFHGIVPDLELDVLIQSADVLVVPGHAEPWGIRINEGIQAGLAVISSDRVGAAELVNFSGAGLVFRSGDQSELARCILSLATNRHLLSLTQLAANAFRPWIEPEIAAKHLLDVVNRSPLEAPPETPWASADARQAVLRGVVAGA